MRLDIPTKTVSVDGEPIKLSKKEYEILRMLAEKPDHVYSRASIVARVWEERVSGETVLWMAAYYATSQETDKCLGTNNQSFEFGYCITLKDNI